MFSMIDVYDFNNYDDDNGIGDGHDFWYDDDDDDDDDNDDDDDDDGGDIYIMVECICVTKKWPPWPPVGLLMMTICI